MKKLSDPNFYAIKDKNGKVQIRRKKAQKVDVDQKEQELEQVQPAHEEPDPTAKERKEKTL